MWPIMFVVNSCLPTYRCYRHCKISVPAEILILELWMCWPDKFASWVCVKSKDINGRITAAHSTHRLHWAGCPTSASSVSLFTSSDMLLAQVSSHQSRRGILQMHRGVCCIPMNSLPPFICCIPWWGMTIDLCCSFWDFTLKPWSECGRSALKWQ